MLLFKLALLWGVPDPDVLADSLAPEIVDKWMAFDAIEPIGEAWTQAGTIAAAVANAVTSMLSAYSGRAVAAGDLIGPSRFIPRPGWYQAEQAEQRESRGLTDQESAEQMRGLT